MQEKLTAYRSCVEGEYASDPEDMKHSMVMGRSFRGFLLACFDGNRPSYEFLSACVKRHVKPPESLDPLDVRVADELAQLRTCSLPTPAPGVGALADGVWPLVPWQQANEAALVGVGGSDNAGSGGVSSGSTAAGAPAAGSGYASDNGVALQWGPGDNRCWPAGSDSNIRYDFLFRGLYAPQLIRFLTAFPREQVMVVESGELRADPQRVMNEVYDFIGVPHVDVSGYNDTTINELINKRYPLFEDVSGWKIKSEYAPLDPKIREALVEAYRPFNRELYHLLGRRFEGWDR